MYTKYFKRIIAFVIVLSMVFTSVAMAMPYGQAKKFIRNGYSWEKVQKYVQGKGIMKGFPDGKFYENLYVKRADAIVMIDRAFKLNALIDSLNIDYEELFDDVEVGEYYFHSIYIARALGITKGIGNNKFNPKHSVTIEEVILLIERAMGKNKYFEFDEDIDLREDYKELVGKGPNGKTKDLKDFATRGEIAAMLYYVLTGSKYDGEPVDEEENEDKITRTMKENEELKFDVKYDNKDSLIENIEDLIDDDLDYVKFTKPLNKDNSFLYYDYDEDDSSHSFVIKGKEYYVKTIGKQMDLSEVTIVPKTTGVLKIEFTAYDKDDKPYDGIIEITVEPMLGELLIDENDIDDFAEEVKGYLEEFDEYDFEEIIFEKLDEDDDYDLKIEGRIRSLFGRNISFERLGKVKFIDGDDFDGTTSLKYTVTTDDGLKFTGLIEIDD